MGGSCLESRLSYKSYDTWRKQIDYIGTQATVLDGQLFILSQCLPHRETAIMFTMAIRRLIQQRTKEKAKNKPNHIYVDREGGKSSEGQRQRERERLRMGYLIHYGDWARGWTDEIRGSIRRGKDNFRHRIRTKSGSHAAFMNGMQGLFPIGQSGRTAELTITTK